MSMDKIDGNPVAMATFSQTLVAPPIPEAVLSRLANMPNMNGTFEGIAMSFLDKVVTTMAFAYLTKSTEEMVTHTIKTKAAAAAYTAADLASSAKLVSAGAKLAQQGLGLVKQVAGSGSGTGSGKTGEDPTGKGPSDKPPVEVPIDPRVEPNDPPQTTIPQSIV